MGEKQRASTYIFNILFLGLFTLVVLVWPSESLAIWTEPQEDPPGGNVAAPLNVSSINQVKTGGLTIQGGLTVGTLPTSNWALESQSPSAAGGQLTSGIYGRGASAAQNGWSAGVYGIGSPNTNPGIQIGLLGVAGATTSTSYGLYATDGGGVSAAYAGYFRGQVLVEGSIQASANPDNPVAQSGSISATKFCLGVDCITSWPSGGGGGESLFTENPPNNTYLQNTTSDLALGGVDSSSGAFYFRTSGPGRGAFFAEQSVTIGEPGTAMNGNHFCETGEICTPSYDDCWNQQANCPNGQYCQSGSCVVTDSEPPQLVGNITVSTTTNSAVVIFQTNEPSTSNLNYKQGTSDPDQGGTPAPNPPDTTADSTSHAISISGLTPGTIYSYRLHLKDGANNEYIGTINSFTTDAQVPGDTTPPTVPQNLRLNGSVTQTSIPLTWDPSTDAGGSGMAGYRIFRCIGGGCTPALFFDTGTTSTVYVDGGLATGTTYRYQVLAYDGNDNESGLSNILQATTAEGGGGGGSPAILKPLPGGSDQGGGGQQTSSELPAASVARKSEIYEEESAPQQTGITKPLSRLLSIPQAQAKLGILEIPAAIAAAPFDGNPNIRLSVNNGVIQVNNAGAIMEIGNDQNHTVPGHDIASTGAIYLRPNDSNAGSYFEGSGATQNLILTGYARLGNTTNTTAGNIRFTGADFEGYVGGQWLSLTEGDGGTGIDINEYIWNSTNPPGDIPPGTAQSNTSINIGLGATFGGDLNAANGTLIALAAGRVGIGVTPSASYKLDVAGNINTTGSYYQGGVVGTTNANGCGAAGEDNSVVTRIVLRGGIVTSIECEADDGGGGGDISGSGTTNTIPKFTGTNAIGDSVIKQNQANLIGINRGLDPIEAQLDVDGSVRIRGGLNIDVDDDGIQEFNLGLNGSTPNLVAGPSVSSNAFIVSNNGSIWARGTGGDIVIGGINFSQGQNVNAAELCFTNSCIDAWSDLILNSQVFAGQQASASFNIAGSGSIGSSLTITNGPVNLPTTDATNLPSSLVKDGQTLQGHKISSKYIFGGNVAGNTPLDPNAWGLAFVEDNDANNPILVIKENREVHFGYATGASKICLYGTGSPVCRNTWPDGGGDVNPSEYIWNSSDPPGDIPPGAQSEATIEIGLSATIGQTLTAGGGTFTASTTGVGIGITDPTPYLLRTEGSVYGFQYTTPSTPNDGANWRGFRTGGDTFIEGAIDAHASSIIGHNAYATHTGGESTYKWSRTHGSFGSRMIRFRYGGNNSNGIMFYADAVATTANREFTPTQRMIIANTGNVGIGDGDPAAMLTVGSGDLFQVNSSGNIVKINNVSYSWPGSQASGAKFLRNDGAGNLSWADGGGGVNPDEYIWNSSNPPGDIPPGAQSNATINLGLGATFGGTLIGGAGTLTATTSTVTIDPTIESGAALDVRIPSGGTIYLGVDSVQSTVQFTNGRLASSNSFFRIQSDDIPLTFEIGNAEKMRINSSNGYVGIGTTTTGSLLTVGNSGSPFTASHTIAGYNAATSTAYNAVAGFKSGALMKGSGVYGELIQNASCADAEVCAGVSGSASNVDGSASRIVAGVYGASTDPDSYGGFFRSSTKVNSNNADTWYKASMRAHNDAAPGAPNDAVVAVAATTGSTTDNFLPANHPKTAIGVFANPDGSAFQDTGYRSIGVLAHGGQMDSGGGSGTQWSYGVMAIGGGDSVSGSLTLAQSYGVYAEGGTYPTCGPSCDQALSYGIYAKSLQPTRQNSYAGYFEGKVAITNDLIATANTRANEERIDMPDVPNGAKYSCPGGKFVCGIDYYDGSGQDADRFSGVYCCDL